MNDDNIWIKTVDIRVESMPLSPDSSELSTGIGMEDLGKMHCNEYKANESNIPENDRKSVAISRLEGFFSIRHYIQTKGSREQKFHLDASIIGAVLFAALKEDTYDELLKYKKIAEKIKSDLLSTLYGKISLAVEGKKELFAQFEKELTENSLDEKIKKIISEAAEKKDSEYPFDEEKELEEIFEIIEKKESFKSNNNKKTQFNIEDGLFKEHYDNGRLKIKGKYLNELRDGVWEFYYSNEQVAVRCGFKKDLRNGKWEEFYWNGKKKSFESFLNDKLDGEVRTYYPNGKIKNSCRYQKGEFYGPVYFYNDEGDLYKEEYHFNNKLHSKEEALIFLKKAIELNPNNFLNYYLKGNLLMSEYSTLNTAIADYTKVIELKPDFANAYYNRAITLNKRGREFVKPNIEANREYSDLYDGTFEKKLREGDKESDNMYKSFIYTQVIPDLNKYIELNPDDANGYYVRGNAKKNTRNYKGAITDYTKAIEFEPNGADAYYNRAETNFQLYDRNNSKKEKINLKNILIINQGLEDFTKAIELNPEFNTKSLSEYMKPYQLLSDYGKSFSNEELKKGIKLNNESSINSNYRDQFVDANGENIFNKVIVVPIILIVFFILFIILKESGALD